LGVIIKDSDQSALRHIGNFENLRHLSTSFVGIEKIDPHCAAPLILPLVNYCIWKWDLETCDIIKWIAQCRFQDNCEFHIAPVDMEEEASEVLNPLFEAYASRLVKFEVVADPALFSAIVSSICNCTQRVDFGTTISPPAALFTGPKLSSDIDIWVDFTDGIQSLPLSVFSRRFWILDIRTPLVIHLHARTKSEILWEPVETLQRLIATLQALAIDLKTCGIIVLFSEGAITTMLRICS
jgi:hypothetical protein